MKSSARKALVGITLAALSTSLSGWGAQAATVKVVTASPATLAALQKSIATSLKAKDWPKDLTPALSKITTPNGVYENQGSSYTWNCPGAKSMYDYDRPEPCYFGDKTSSKVLLLWGDSNAGNWIPTLDLAAKQRKLKLALLVAPGCNTLLDAPADKKGCISWQAALPALVGKLQPVAIISARLAQFVRGSGADTRKYSAAWKRAFDLLTAKARSAKRLMITSTPNSWTMKSLPGCLSTQSRRLGYIRALLACSPSENPKASGATELATYERADRAAAMASRAVLIDAIPWFCQTTSKTHNVCPIVIDKYLVYVDGDHLSIPYAQRLASPMADALASAGL